MKCKKQRGQKRRLNALLENISYVTPFKDTTARYDHFRVPCDRFISSPKTSGKIKTSFCKAWLEKTEDIIKLKPASIPFCKVVAIINSGDLWESQIVVFYDKSYYDSFWIRSLADQVWTPIEDNARSFARERNITTSLKEVGYIEAITEGDFSKKTTLWFYGDI